ncbi:MAG: DUF167 domain-containing protein [Candidatus Liptonbacteria bacterium]|nr:DUF167 domain-containing protein [Candidatus Liptonbacteria bacterium]
MKIFVKAKPSAKVAGVQKIDDLNYIVAVTDPPKDGKANIAITKALAEYFAVPLSRVRLISGFSARQKTFEIL